jgi:hypothetical protein
VSEDGSTSPCVCSSYCTSAVSKLNSHQAASFRQPYMYPGQYDRSRTVEAQHGKVIFTGVASTAVASATCCSRCCACRALLGSASHHSSWVARHGCVLRRWFTRRETGSGCRQ